jgi:hypothetical protein
MDGGALSDKRSIADSEEKQKQYERRRGLNMESQDLIPSLLDNPSNLGDFYFYKGGKIGFSSCSKVLRPCCCFSKPALHQQR